MSKKNTFFEERHISRAFLRVMEDARHQLQVLLNQIDRIIRDAQLELERRRGGDANNGANERNRLEF